MLAARDHAIAERRTIGDVISAWARAGLASRRPVSASADDEWLTANGLALLPRRDVIVTSADVNRLRDELFV